MGLVDYNSWVESPEGLALGKKLDKNVVIVEGMHISLLMPSEMLIVFKDTASSRPSETTCA